MNRITQQERNEKGLNFFGAITRSLSHDLNNVVAIITELAGLIEDFLFAAKQGTPLDTGRLENTVERIVRQLERGKNYIKQLNRFGHSVDDPRTSIEAGEILERVVDYSRRFATLKKMSLMCSCPEKYILLEGSPFDLQHVLYRCIDAALGASTPGAEITVELEEADDGARFIISGQEVGESSDETSSRLILASQLVEGVGGKLETTVDEGKPLKLIIVLPSALRLLSALTEEPG